MARVVLARLARSQFRALTPRLAEAVLDALALLEADAELGHALRGRLEGVLALRIGVYRILYGLRDGGKTVRVLSIRHRQVVYKSDPR
ncbi:MAG: type II toxin-antitoxin system RelE/ParE family toxin [Acidobacteria bacterium]|nr:type II toxin-antitoxin system RelE/ParE family toxin [Acidobacteriota bacterium]